MNNTVAKIFLLTLSLALVLSFAGWASSVEETNDDTGAVLGSYEIVETITQDGCFSARKDFTRSFTAHWVKFKDHHSLINLDTALMNPLEHEEVVFKNPESPGTHQISIVYSDFGKVTSNLSAKVEFKNGNLTGNFSNEVVHELYTQEFSPFALWIQSTNGYQKIPVSLETLPLIDSKSPCTITGKWAGKYKLDSKFSFTASKEIEYRKIMRQAEEVFSQGKMKESIAGYEKASALYPNRAGPYWRISRSYFIIAEHLDTKDREGRLQRLALARSFGEKAIAADPDSGESWFFLTAARGRFATTKGIIKTIRVTGELERGFLKTIEKKPRYNFSAFNTAGDTHCGLGIYYRLVPDSWFVKTLTGSRGDIDKSIKHLRKALLYQPYRIEYNKELGVSLLCRGVKKKHQSDIEEGLEILKNALTFPNLLKTDPIDKNHIQDLLVDYKKACGYSRDGYQDVSEERLNEIK